MHRWSLVIAVLFGAVMLMAAEGDKGGNQGEGKGPGAVGAGQCVMQGKCSGCAGQNCKGDCGKAGNCNRGGPNCIDSDGDGVCDNAGECQRVRERARNRNGQGQGQGQCQGQGQGQGQGAGCGGCGRGGGRGKGGGGK